jgi:DNA-directed RNA polymerase specialized sigma24 family protein
MKSVDGQDRQQFSRGQYFLTTHWSVVLKAGKPGSPDADAALEELCRTYWYPLYAFVRREGHDETSAKDLTQAFFARLLARDDLATVSPDKGKFRSFLLSSMRHFLCDEWDKVRAKKRGGGRELVSLDAQDGEERYRLEPVDGLTPEKLFERRWVDTLLAEARARLRAEFEHAEKLPLYLILQPYESEGEDAPAYAEAARQAGKTEGSLKSDIFRFRRRFHELVREEVARTVDDGEVDEEIRHLLRVIGS